MKNNLETKYPVDKARAEAEEIRSRAKVEAYNKGRGNQEPTEEDYDIGEKKVEYYKEREKEFEQCKPELLTWIDWIKNSGAFISQAESICSAFDTETHYAGQAASQARARVRQYHESTQEGWERRCKAADNTAEEVFEHCAEDHFGRKFFPNKSVLIDFFIQEGKRRFPKISDADWGKIGEELFFGSGYESDESFDKDINNHKTEITEENTDRNFILENVKNDPMSFGFINPKYRDDKEIAIAAIQRASFNFNSVGEKLKTDQDILVEAIVADENNLEEIDEKLRKKIADNRDLVLKIAKRNGDILSLDRMLKDFPDFVSYRKDREVALVAIGSSGYPPRIYEKLPQEFQLDKEFAIAAVRQYKGSIDSLPTEVVDDEVIELALAKGLTSYNYKLSEKMDDYKKRKGYGTGKTISYGNQVIMPKK